MVLSRETFETIKDDLHVRGLYLNIKPKLDISLGAFEGLVSEDNLGFEGNHDPEALGDCDYPYIFKSFMHLDEFVRRYDAAGKALDIKEADAHYVAVSLMLCAVNPKCPDDGVSDTFLQLHNSGTVPIVDGVPDLALYVKAYFENCFIDREVCEPEQLLEKLFPDSYATS